jgi:hypothetical protein
MHCVWAVSSVQLGIAEGKPNDTRSPPAWEAGDAHLQEASTMPAIDITLRTFTLRRRAARQGFWLWKVRKGSCWYRRSGPYALIRDDTNTIVSKGMTLDEVAARLNA